MKKNKQLTPFFLIPHRSEKRSPEAVTTQTASRSELGLKIKTLTDDITILSQSWMCGFFVCLFFVFFLHPRLPCHNQITGAHFKRTPRRQEMTELMNSEQTRLVWNKHTSGSGSEPQSARPPAPPHRTIHMLNEITQTDDSVLLSLLALCLCLKSCRDVDKVKPESFLVNGWTLLIGWYAKTKG